MLNTFLTGSKIHQWPGLKTIIEIDSIRELKDHCTREKRYYISSLESDAAALAPIITRVAFKGCFQDGGLLG